MSQNTAYSAIPVLLLSLLRDRPRPGYELMQLLENRFGGRYSPSSGMVQPRLRQLEGGGLITRERDGRGAMYAITEAGRAELHRREAELHLVEVGVRRSLRVLTELIREDVRATVAALCQELRGGSGRTWSGTPYIPSGLEGERQRLYDELLRRTDRVRALLTHLDPADGQLGRATEVLNHAFDEAEYTLMSTSPA